MIKQFISKFKETLSPTELPTDILTELPTDILTELPTDIPTELPTELQLMLSSTQINLLDTKISLKDYRYIKTKREKEGIIYIYFLHNKKNNIIKINMFDI